MAAIPENLFVKSFQKINHQKFSPSKISIYVCITNYDFCNYAEIVIIIIILLDS